MARVTVDDIAAWGVVGAGGAGFPTHVKLKAAAQTIILNAAECEPLLHKDKELLKHHTDEVLAGLAAAAELVGAKDVAVGIKGKYHDVIDALRPKLGAGMRIAELFDSYPTGDEFILVHDVTGKIVPPGGIPLAVDCVVINVETAMNIGRAQPVTTKYLTVAGAVAEPVTIGVPLGTTFAQAIELAGGASVPDPVVLVGGVMMGRYCANLSEPVTKTTGGLIGLPRDHSLVTRYTRPWKAIARIGAAACDQCTFCTYFCPRWLLGHPIEPHKAMRSLGFNQAGEANTLGTLYCCECNLCTMMACPEDLDPKNVCTQNKRRLMAEGRKFPAEIEPMRAALHLVNRRVPIARLIRKLGLWQFNNTGPLKEQTLKLKSATLPLKQHAGAPAEPAVRVGDTVRRGQVVARPAEGKLGAVLHAPIDGRVAALNGSVTLTSP